MLSLVFVGYGQVCADEASFVLESSVFGVSVLSLKEPLKQSKQVCSSNHLVESLGWCCQNHSLSFDT